MKSEESCDSMACVTWTINVLRNCPMDCDAVYVAKSMTNSAREAGGEKQRPPAAAGVFDAGEEETTRKSLGVGHGGRWRPVEVGLGIAGCHVPRIGHSCPEAALRERQSAVAGKREKADGRQTRCGVGSVKPWLKLAHRFGLRSNCQMLRAVAVAVRRRGMARGPPQTLPTAGR